jgi:plasmid stability protein
MAQLVVRNLEEDLKARLQRRADRHRHSIEEEVRDILHNAAEAEERTAVPLGSRLRNRFAHIGFDQDIAKLRAPIIARAKPERREPR